MKKRFPSLGLVALILSVCCVTALAAETRASTTLTSYAVTVATGSNSGEIKISYDIKASGIAEKVGISSLKIYKSDGTYITTISGTIKNGLIRTDTNRHRASYIYTGTSGTSYYAVATVFADVSPDSDSKTVTTLSARAR